MCQIVNGPFVCFDCLFVCLFWLSDCPFFCLFCLSLLLNFLLFVGILSYLLVFRSNFCCFASLGPSSVWNDERKLMKSSECEKGFFSFAFPLLFSPLKSSLKIAERKEVKTHDMTLQKIAMRGKKQSISPKWKRGNLWYIFIVNQQFSVFPVFFNHYTSSCNNDLLCLPNDEIAVIMYNT